MINEQQYLRECFLVVAGDSGEGIDLSQMHIKFHITQSDKESPNAAVIRVFNLSEDTVRRITGKTPVEFTRVVLKAGYKNGSSGTIFDGTIKQFRKGRENATDTYLDILASYLDIEYNHALVNASLPAEQTSLDNRLKVLSNATGIPVNYVVGSNEGAGGVVLSRGKVFWGQARVYARSLADTLQSTWSLNNGTIQIIPFQSYLPNEAVVLTSRTGLVGVPEQTEEGIKCRCLLNPKIQVGGRIQIDNASINTTFAQAAQAFEGGQLAFNRNIDALQRFADIAADGQYRVYVAEHVGDTRGNEWYTDIIGLAIDSSSEKVKAKN